MNISSYLRRYERPEVGTLIYSESRGLGTSCIYWTLMNATTIRFYCYVAAVGAKAHEKNYVKGINHTHTPPPNLNYLWSLS